MKTSDNVDRLQLMLEEAGLPVWRDTADLPPGQYWQKAVQRAITDDARVFLACFSRNSLAREKSYQNKELRLAIEQIQLRHPDEPWLIPVRFDDCDIPDLEIGGGQSLTSIHRSDLFGDRRDQEAVRLIAMAREILQRGAGSRSAEERGPAGTSSLDGVSHHADKPSGDLAAESSPTPAATLSARSRPDRVIDHSQKLRALQDDRRNAPV